MSTQSTEAQLVLFLALFLQILLALILQQIEF